MLRSRIILIAFALTSVNVTGIAQTCEYKLKSSKLTWVGYKFTEKFAVSGTFKNIEVQPSDSKKGSPQDFFQGISFKVRTNSLDSGMQPRDEKLVKFLFSTMKNPDVIEGKVLSFDPKTHKAMASLSLNGVSRQVSFIVLPTGESYKFTGSVDLVEFGMGTNVQALSAECGDLHRGKDGKAKTWSEVGLEIIAELDKTCK